MGGDSRRICRLRRHGRCVAVFHASRPGLELRTRISIAPESEAASEVGASFFSFLSRLHAENHVVFAGAVPRVDGPGLVGKTLSARYHLILGALRHANRKFTARTCAVLPAEFLFARAANAQLHAREGDSFVGKHGSADQEVMGVAVFLPAAVCRR